MGVSTSVHENTRTIEVQTVAHTSEEPLVILKETYSDECKLNFYLYSIFHFLKNAFIS